MSTRFESIVEDNSLQTALDTFYSEEFWSTLIEDVPLSLNQHKYKKENNPTIDTELISNGIEVDGYVLCHPEWTSCPIDLAMGVQYLVDLGFPPSFVAIYDETW